MLRAQMISVAQRSGMNHMMVSSWNIRSTAQIKAMFITKLKKPSVTILRGRVIVFKIGFKNMFSNPITIPRRTMTCQLVERGIPKKLESGKIFTLTPGMNKMANHKPKIPAEI